MKKKNKKLLTLNKIVQEYENFYGKSKLERNINNLKNLVEDKKYNEILKAYEEYKSHIFNIFAKTNRVFIRINYTPENIYKVNLSAKKELLQKIFKSYESYYNLEIKNIYFEIKSLQLILNEKELNEILQSIKSYNDYIITIFSESKKVGIFTKPKKIQELYYYDVFKIPE